MELRDVLLLSVGAGVAAYVVWRLISEQKKQMRALPGELHELWIRLWDCFVTDQIPFRGVLCIVV